MQAKYKGSGDRLLQGRYPGAKGGKDPKKFDVDPAEKIEGMLSAVAMMARNKKAAAAAAGAIIDGKGMTPEKAKALIASYTQQITGHSMMWTSIVHLETSLDLTVAYAMEHAAQLAFFVWMMGMIFLVV